MSADSLCSRRLALLAREKDISALIPYSSVPADGVVAGRRGEFYATWALEGLPFETEADEELERRSDLLNLLCRSLPSGSTLVAHRVRRPFADSLSAPAEPGFAREFCERLNARFAQGGLMRTSFYLTLVAEGQKGPALFSKAPPQDFRASLGAFKELARSVGRSLAPFGARRLAERTAGGERFSDQLSFYEFLLSLREAPVRIPSGPVWASLGSARAYFSSDAAEIQGLGAPVFAQGIEIKDFCQETEPGILDPLLYPDPSSGAGDYPFIETHAFRVMGRAEGARFLTLQQRRLIAAGDPGRTQTAQISEALDRLTDGDFVMGEYGYGLLVTGKTELGARCAARDAAEKLRGAGLLPVISTLALPALFFSALPGNFAEAPRVAVVTSRNFVHFTPFHAPLRGKRSGNPWGEALLILKTPASEPYYFNFHATAPREDSFGKTALGNTVIIGSSGAGKTVLVNALCAAAQKYRTPRSPLSVVLFDKDRGSEAAVRSLPRSAYLSLEAGRPTGFNPFACEPTEANVSFLTELTRLLAETDSPALPPGEGEELAHAVRAVMALPREARRLGTLLQNIPGAGSGLESPLPARLARWTGAGDLAWVFDNAEDTLDFTRHDNFGIDGTEILELPAVAGPVAFYLLHRMEEALDGRRFIFVMDEFWKWLSSPVFRDFAANKLKTIRKQNGLGVFATQSPSDVLASPIARDIVEQSATQVFLANPRARTEDYAAGFGVSPEECEAIRAIDPASRLMLVRQGSQGALCRLDLSAFPEALAVFSGTAENNALLRRALSGAGPDAPASQWLPAYLESVARKEKNQRRYA